MLVKRLYAYLSAAGCGAEALRNQGWFSFQNHETHSTDARRLAATALYALLIDGKGNQILHDDCVVYGVLAFLEAQRPGAIRPTRVAGGLAQILSTPPVTLEAIERWVLSVYQ